MYISLKWIKEYTDIVIDQEQLIEKIRSQIGEVEQVIDYNEKYKNILIGQIRSKEDHPSAEKLAVYKVFIGNEVQVVAGDKTLEVGDFVAYFPPMTKVPKNAKPETFDGIVKKVDLRGVESNGMLGSARELDLGNDHTVVMRLNHYIESAYTEQNVSIEEYKMSWIGKNLAQLLNFDDSVVDIENKALANRADCFGVLGIARELAGIQGIKFTTPEWYHQADKSLAKDVETTLPIKLNNQGGSFCPRYMAVSMSDIKVQQSPTWLQSILLKSGVRPINNVVDITNYLMLLTGVPLHAFDYDKLVTKDLSTKSGHKVANITVRTATEGEKITTLDGKTHKLDDKILLICDSSNPIAVAGIMGGLDTEIDNNTKNIIIECANFDKYNVRKSSMKLGIFTEAVTRFTKGQDAEKCEPVLYKAVEMCSDLAGGKLATEPVDSYPSPADKVDIEVSIERLNTHLGTNYSESEIKERLDNVELYSRHLKDGWIVVDIPSWRGDLRIKEDIHEEVGRLNGYNTITKTLPLRSITPVEKNKKVVLQAKARKILTAAGVNEILTYNFQGADLFQKYKQNLEVAYHLRNSLSPDLEYMRTALLPSILEKVNLNIQDGYKEIALFEINKVHSKLEIGEDQLPIERTQLGVVLSVENRKAEESYSGSPFYQAKEYLNHLLSSLNLNSIQYTLLADKEGQKLPAWVQNMIPMYNENSSAIVSHRLFDQEQILGIVGTLDLEVAKESRLPSFTSGFELNIDTLLQVYSGSPSYAEPSRFPKVSNDLCFILNKDLKYEHISELIKKEANIEGSDNIVTVDAVDIYQSEKQKEEDKKQITYRVTVQNKVKTLTNDEVNNIISNVVKAVKKSSGGELV